MKRKLTLTKKGFNAFEAAIVLLAIAVVLGVAIPNFMRSRVTTNETAAITNLHKLASAFEAYRARYGSYPDSFSKVCGMEPRLLDEKLCLGKKQGYTFTIATGSDITPTYAFRIQADPDVKGQTGNRSFRIGSNTAEVNGVAYYALDTPGPWKPIGYEVPAGSGSYEDPDDPEPPLPCAGLCCSSCSGAGCVYTVPPCPGTTGGSCPYVHVWDGKEFVKDNDIIPGANPREYTDYYKLAKAPMVDKSGLLKLKIVEPLEEKSYLDRVELFEVRHPAYVKVAPTPQGEFFAFREALLKPALKAVDAKSKDVLRLVSSKAKGDYHGFDGDFITFDFGKVKDAKNGLRLILSSDLAVAYAAGEEASQGGGIPIEGSGKECTADSLHIELLLEGKSWQEVAVIHPHESWDIWAIDLTPYLAKITANLEVKIAWTKEHKLDFCLLDTSRIVPIKVHKLALSKAQHSKQGDVFVLLDSSDNNYARMVKADEINLAFIGSKGKLAVKDTSSFILVTEGFYKTLKK